MVRHGETEWHKENRYAGHSDIALTSKGEAQARYLARWAIKADLTAIWSSPLSRAYNTALPVAKTLHLPLQIDDRLIELNFGQGEGLTREEMLQQFPEAYAAFQIDPVKNFLPEGENPVNAAMRAYAALSNIAELTGPTRRVLVIAHNTLLRLVLCHLLGIPLSRYRKIFPLFDNCSLTEIDFHPGRKTSLLHFNAPLEHNL